MCASPSPQDHYFVAPGRYGGALDIDFGNAEHLFALCLKLKHLTRVVHWQGRRAKEPAKRLREKTN